MRRPLQRVTGGGAVPRRRRGRSRAAALAAAVLLACVHGSAAAADAPPPAPAVEPLRGAALLERLGVQFVRIPGGEFTMGAEEETEVEAPNPPRRVALRPFEISRFEITQRQWQLVMGTNPSRFNDCPDCPAERVSWHMAQEFLAQVEKLTGERWRLPTEAEWEFAAGEGAAHRRWAGTDDEAQLREYAWFRPNAGMATHPVGGKRANAFGLHDMSGNVYEWCADWRSPLAAGAGAGVEENPAGPPEGQFKILRGGSYGIPAFFQRVVYREWSTPETGFDDNGLRPVRDAR